MCGPTIALSAPLPEAVNVLTAASITPARIPRHPAWTTEMKGLDDAVLYNATGTQSALRTPIIAPGVDVITPSAESPWPSPG